MMLTTADFPAFFAAVHAGQSPFAWQVRLLDEVVATGRWPDQVSAPTGAGKTAVIDVHVFAVALMATGAGPRVPRRLSLVVDRRALVDSQFDQASSLNAMLRSALGVSTETVQSRVAAALESLRTARGAGEGPICVALLRGGAQPTRSWIDDPAAAAIICATPDMWGSRLLFRGYGTPRLARPREAGLLAYDSVVVVDEAHLARQLVVTARRIDALEAVAPRGVPVQRIQVVEASATPNSSPHHRAVGVTDADLSRDGVGPGVLARRLVTAKPLSLISFSAWPASSEAARKTLARQLADQAQDLRSAHGPTVACIVNTVATALAVTSELRSRGLTCEVLVGRMRPHDVLALKERRPGLLSVAGDPTVDVLVATQTIEVGVDLDCSSMITELASGSAIAQRAGRVNRLGNRASTEVRVVVPEGPLPAKGAPPYTIDELAAAMEWVTRRAASPDGLAPVALMTDPAPEASARRDVFQRPEPWDVSVWARTSDDLATEPELDLWLADDLVPDSDASIVVRQGIPADPILASSLLRATPPRQAECIPVSLARLAELRSGVDDVVRAVWRGDDLLDPIEAGSPRPGDVVIVGTETRWFDQGVATRVGATMATDVFDERGPGEPAITRLAPGSPLDLAVGGQIAQRLLREFGGIVAETATDGRVRRRAMADAVRDLTARIGVDMGRAAHARLSSLEALLRERVRDADVILGPDVDGAGPGWVVVVDLRRHVGTDEQIQTWSSGGGTVTLDAHQEAVASRARELGNRLGLTDPFGRVLELAGALHDEGKRDARFQSMLAGDSPELDPSTALAKSGTRTPAQTRAAIAGSGLPARWRHEQLSAVIAADRLHGDPAQQLAVRLAGTSHGHGRFAFPHASQDLGVEDPSLGVLSIELHDEGGWDAVVDETHRSHGVWGCAYLEAILRAADCQVSREGS